MQQVQPSIHGQQRGPSAFVAVVIAALVCVVAVLTGISEHEEPGARYVVLQCQGFDALASAGTRRMSCESDPAAAADGAVSPVRPVDDHGDVPAETRRKV